MASEQTSSLRRFFAAVKESLSGQERDYTEGSIPLAVFLLAVPMILELSLESVFAVVDIFFVSKLGENAIQTVGLTESVITIVYSLGLGLSMGATAIVARRTGEKNPEAAAHAGAQSLLIAFLISIVLGVIGIIFAGDILRLMNASPAVVAEGTTFTRIMLGCNLPIILLFLINGIFRGVGNAAMAMKSLWIASLLNIILCPILIHYLGLKGAAIATVIGRSAGVAYQCYHLFRGKGALKMNLAHFRWAGDIIRNILNTAWPATLQFFIQSGSWIVLAAIVADTGGTEASAGYQIAIRNVVFFILPAWGLSNAAATLVGQNLGAKRPDRAEQSVLLITKYNIFFMSGVMALFLLAPTHIIQLFTDKPSLIYYGALSLQIIGAGYVFYGIGMVMMQALNGAGDTRTPTIINFFCFWLFQIPLACLLAYAMDMKATGAFLAVPIAETVIALIAFWYFKRGKWKLVEV